MAPLTSIDQRLAGIERRLDNELVPYDFDDEAMAEYAVEFCHERDDD